MEKFIQNYLELNKYNYIKIENHEIINHIYNLYKYGIDERDTFKMEDSIIDLYYGVYYRIKKDYDQMNKYYLIAIEKNNAIAMNNLGFHYQIVEKDYEQMKKYYFMAIEKGNTKAMNNLGFYYGNIEKDYERMKKYYRMAIEKGNKNAFFHLEQFHKDSDDTLELLRLYIKIDNKTKISDILVNYCNQKIINKEINSILLQYLSCIDDHDLPVLFKLFKQLFNNQIDLLSSF